MKFSSTIAVLLASCLSTSHAFAPHSSRILTSTASTNPPQRSSASHLMAESSSSSSGNPFSDFFSGLFPTAIQEKVEPEKPKIPDCVVDSDYTLTYVFGAIGVFILATSPGTCQPVLVGEEICD